MSDSYGRTVTVHVFGESHGAGIGAAIDGIEPGLKLDMDRLRFQMQRRAPGGKLSTSRREADEIEWISGIRDGITCGTTIVGLIRNTNTHSQDYEKTKDLLRPSHADYTAHVKYHGYEDPRGGGHFSARVTAGLVMAGAICEQALWRHLSDYCAGSHLLQVYDIREEAFAEHHLVPETMAALNQERIPVLQEKKRPEIEHVIEEARKEQDSVGGVIETAVLGVPAGLGDPFFDSMESRLAQILFSIPALKGVSFGAGFAIAGMKGSEANDPYEIRDGRIVTKTNHNGGILGGITTGMPVVFQTAFKPTPSISRPQDTVNILSMQEESLSIVGRHDPAVIVRAVPIVEAASAIAVYDAWKEWRSLNE